MPVPKKFAYQSARASWPLLSFATRLSKHRTRHRQASCSPKILQIWSCRMKNLQKTESSNLQKHLCAESTTISVCLTTGFVIDNRGDMGAGAMELEGKFSEAGPESDSGPGRAATARGVPEPSCGPCGHDSRSFLRVARHWSPGPRASGDRRGQPSHGRAKAGGETRACGPSTRFTLDRGRDFRVAHLDSRRLATPRATAGHACTRRFRVAHRDPRPPLRHPAAICVAAIANGPPEGSKRSPGARPLSTSSNGGPAHHGTGEQTTD